MPKNNQSNARPEAGFTLVELLLVVMLIGVMAGTLLSVINYRQHQNNAKDAIIRSNMEKLATGIEAYRTVENEYPADTNGDGDPSEDAYLINYLRNGWLNDQPVGTVYTYYTDPSRADAAILVTLNSGKKLKYTTEWSQVKDCESTAVIADDSCL